jgi:hypothetical protein
MFPKRGLIFLLAATLATLLATDAFAGGYSVSAVGVRARSMGGAFRAVADDWSAIYYNPAGLAKIEESQLNLSLNLMSPLTAIVSVSRPAKDIRRTMLPFALTSTRSLRHLSAYRSLLPFPYLSLMTSSSSGTSIGSRRDTTPFRASCRAPTTGRTSTYWTSVQRLLPRSSTLRRTSNCTWGSASRSVVVIYIPTRCCLSRHP